LTIPKDILYLVPFIRSNSAAVENIHEKSRCPERKAVIKKQYHIKTNVNAPFALTGSARKSNA
jgi:hypothetical protein